MVPPLVILLLSIATVIGLIVVFRANAFLALIVSAMLAGVLSVRDPWSGELAEKIARVATAFGEAAGSIGIVIALAAVIGKCLSDSGAADRIVRAFMKLLGEKGTPVALLASGYVLGVPVFFDTVFYLLVPLARSLWRRTRKNYMLYLLAIAAGGVITHTLVPPTPGPLAMAENLNIDLGVMIVVGFIIGLPVAAVGLIAARIMSLRMDIPMRPYTGEEELQPMDDAQLPPLWLSLVPVLLPVLLISANTGARMQADAEHAAMLRPGDVDDWPALGRTLRAADGNPAAGVAGWVRGSLPRDVLASLDTAARTGVLPAEVQPGALAALNRLLKNRKFLQDDAYAGITLPEDARRLAGRSREKLSEAKVERLNRLVLETTFPGAIRPHVWDTAWRRTANVTAVLGNANLALLLSALVAMFLLVRQRKLSFLQLGQTTEVALMSGGVIILITAAGGAFGIMLKEANIKDAITDLLGTGGQARGLVMILVGYAVATMMKIAQGSGTVSMLTTSAMLAAMGVSSESLGFHPVYLATAIGSGSVTGSWMNDSGFWIFARMGVLTEVEALKSWTILLVILGLAGLGFSALGAWLLPLV